VGYANDHAGNVYHMFNLQTKQIWVTHDVRWIKLSATPEVETSVETKPTKEKVLDEYDDDAGVIPFNHCAPAEADKTPMTTATNSATMATAKQAHARVLCEMKHLGEWFNPMALEYIAHSKENEKLKVIDEEVDKDNDPDNATAYRAGREVANAMLSHAVSKFAFYSAAKVIEKQAAVNGEDHHFVEPKNFCEAFDHPRPTQREKWRAAIHKEFGDMTNRSIWHKVKQSQVPAGQCCIKCSGS